MSDVKTRLAKWIDDDRDTIIGFLCDFVRAKSPNPPGDTTLAAAHVTRYRARAGSRSTFACHRASRRRR